MWKWWTCFMPHGFHRLSFPKSLAASAFTWWSPCFFMSRKTSTRLRHATRFSEPGLCHDFGAQDTVLQRHNWCRCVGFFRVFVYGNGHPSHNENPNIMCMYHIIYICVCNYLYTHWWIFDHSPIWENNPTLDNGTSGSYDLISTIDGAGRIRKVIKKKSCSNFQPTLVLLWDPLPEP
jgi:hypothetical protein